MIAVAIKRGDPGGCWFNRQGLGLVTHVDITSPSFGARTLNF